MKGKTFSVLGKWILAVLIIAMIVVAFFGYQIYRLASPQKTVEPVSPEKFLLSFYEIDFPSADGLALTGWFIPGVKKGPALILCHKLGGSKASLINLAVPLQMEGYNIFLFDFRNSGESRGKLSSFGILEARDVIGAVDFVMNRNDIDQSKIGLYGVEMGAYAAALGAVERKNIKAIALDSAYPDIRFFFTRQLFDDSPSGRKYLSFIPLFVYSAYFRVDPREQSVTEAVKKLADRNLLFIVGMGDREMMESTRQLYKSVSESKDSDKNLLELPRSLSSELYGEDKKSYDEKILSFFKTYLPVEKKHPVFESIKRPTRK